MNWFKKLLHRRSITKQINLLKTVTDKKEKEYYSRVENQLRHLAKLMQDKNTPTYCRLSFSTETINGLFSALSMFANNHERGSKTVPLHDTVKQRQLKGWLVDESGNILEIELAIAALKDLVIRCNKLVSKTTDEKIKTNLYGFVPIWNDVDSFILSCYERLLKECS